MTDVKGALEGIREVEGDVAYAGVVSGILCSSREGDEEVAGSVVQMFGVARLER